MIIQERKRAICIGMMLVCATFVGMSTNASAAGSPPVAEADGPYEAPECYSVILDASHSYDPDNEALTYRWFINGSWIDNYGNPLMDYLWLDDFSGEATLEVSDGTFTATDTASVTIYNTPPQILSTDGSIEVNLGDPVNIAVNFFDGLYDPQRGMVIPSLDTFTATFYWGDFSSDVLSLGAEEFWANASHIYSEPGIYHIAVTVVDDNGGMASTDWYVKVGEDLPEFEAGPDHTINEGDAFLSYGYFMGIDGESYTATVDYGDGSGVQPLNLSSGYTFDLSHQYFENGVYTVIVSIYWFGEFYGSDSALVTVLNVAPTAMLVNDGPKDEGSPVTISFTSQYDPGIYDTFTYSFDLNNDGIYEIADQTDASTVYTWYDDGIYMVGGKIQDDDGGFNAYATSVVVENVPPTIISLSTSPTSPVKIGTSINLSGLFTDPGIFDSFVAIIEWGDGQTSTIDLPAGEYNVSGNHVYANTGSFMINLTIIDDDGGFDTMSLGSSVVIQKNCGSGCGHSTTPPGSCHNSNGNNGNAYGKDKVKSGCWYAGLNCHAQLKGWFIFNNYWAKGKSIGCKNH